MAAFFARRTTTGDVTRFRPTLRQRFGAWLIQQGYHLVTGTEPEVLGDRNFRIDWRTTPDEGPIMPPRIRQR